MVENNASPLPHFDALRELVDFFESHDMGDYWDYMPETDFEVDMKRKCRLVSIDEDLISQLSDIAKSRQVSVEALIELWLKERAAGASH